MNRGAEQPEISQSRFLSWWGAGVRALPWGRHVAFQCGWRLAGRPNRFVGELAGAPFVVDAADRYSAMHMFLWGIYEPELSLAFLATLRPGMTVVDIGANKGYFSVLAARAVTHTGRVVSYEPLPRNFADLAATVALSGHPRWTSRAAAVSARRGEVMLSSSGIDQGHSGWAAVSLDGTVSVDAVTLDDEAVALGLEHIDVLKMDIEGHEAEAIKGMHECLAHRRITHIFLELHVALLSEPELDSLVAAFEDNGYRGFILLQGPEIARRAADLVTTGRATGGVVALCPFSKLSLGDAGALADSRAHLWWTLESQS